jgi:hypothetical protein
LKNNIILIVYQKTIRMANNRGGNGNNLGILLEFALGGDEETIPERCQQAQEMMRGLLQNGDFPARHTEIAAHLVNVAGPGIWFEFRQARNQITFERDSRRVWHRIERMRNAGHPDFDRHLNAFPGEPMSLAERVILRALDGDWDAIQVFRSLARAPEDQNAAAHQVNNR